MYDKLAMFTLIWLQIYYSGLEDKGPGEVNGRKGREFKGSVPEKGKKVEVEGTI